MEKEVLEKTLINDNVAEQVEQEESIINVVEFTGLEIEEEEDIKVVDQLEELLDDTSSIEGTVTENPSEEVLVTSNPTVDTTQVNSGIVKIRCSSKKRVKVIIEKNKQKYTYDLSGNNQYESFPLQMGNGQYSISVLENISGSNYKRILSRNVNVALKSANLNYLSSHQLIKWNSSMESIKKAQVLAKGVNTNQKINKIYSYIVNNMKYNNEIKSLPSNYISNLIKVYSSKKGICYDFAVLFAAMMRSVKVPTKLIMGTSKNVKGYHAWNKVYINGKWQIIDTSYDAQMKAAKKKTSMYKTTGYTQQKEY